MKSITLKTVALAIIVSLGAASGTANAWGRHGGHYYHHHGPNGWVVGAALGLAAAGTYVALSQPRYVYPAAPVYAAPAYPYAAPVYPVAPSVTYSTPPMAQYAPQSAAMSTDVIAYPAQGQSPEQQADDRAACEQWAANQSGFDPAQASQWTTTAQTDSYSRSIGACMKGRGYSIN
jgi:hypothetical protein